ncbi:MFS transporter [Paenibacillus sp. UNC499MF]|uniref:MFS transporter n=1 Tax=Paenibacillus sp. UNC499MF TaxID=1502751 RepID=UPI00089FA6A7|nr:MFS transporter [Paenibacillus sp. UNC499MF]SEF51307.1 Predicted arabinose efflux permease, MFS family [Paenibacillus sp. UNC499MF]
MNVFQNRMFVKLFTASFFSQLGTMIGNMAFAFFLLDRFSSQPFYMTLAEMMYSLPTLFVFFIVGVAADRMNRKSICLYSNYIRIGLTALLFLSLFLEVLPLTFLILFLRGAVAKFFAPAEIGLVQGILSKDQYMQAAGLNQTVFGLFMLFGTALGALAYHWIGVEGAVVIDGLGFILSALLIRSCSFEEKVEQPNGPGKWRDMSVKTVWVDFAEGMRYIWRKPLLLSMITGFILFGFVNGGFAVLPLFTLKYKLATGEYEKFASLYSICLGVGVLAGSALGAILAKKIKPHVMIIGSVVSSGLMVIVGNYITDVWLFILGFLLMGILIAPANIAIGGWMPQIVDGKMMGRVNAWIDPLMMGAQSLALGLIALFYPRFVSLDWIYIVLGLIMLVVAAFYTIMLPKQAAEEETLSKETQEKAVREAASVSG